MIRRGRLIENIFSLISLRGLEYLLGILLIPYLVRVLGPEKFGAIAFMQGILQYFNLVIDYGFNLTAPRDIAQASREQLPRLFSAFVWGKLFIGIGVTAVFFIIMIVVQNFSKLYFDYMLFTVLYSAVIGNLIFPIWFFQGIQQMRYIALVNIIGRILMTVCIFIMVRSPSDYIWAALFQSCTPVIAGLCSWGIIVRWFPDMCRRPDWNDIGHVYREGWHVFLSTVAINFYTASNIVILGFLTNDTVVGYYSGAAKLIEYVKRLIDPVSQAVYPYVSELIQHGRRQGRQFLHWLLVIFGGGGFAFSLALWLVAPMVVQIILGDQYDPSIGILRWMAFVPFMVCLSNVFGIQTMLPLGMERIFSRILIGSAVFSLLLIGPLTVWYGAEGTAMTMLFTESFVTIVMGSVLYYQGVFFRSEKKRCCQIYKR